MSTGKGIAQAPTASENDLGAEVAEMRRIITDLETDRDTAITAIDALENRLLLLEQAPSGSGGVPAAPIERELGKLRRTVSTIHDAYFRNVEMEPAEPLVPAEADKPATVTDGNVSTAATSVAGTAS